jgi:membrane protein
MVGRRLWAAFQGFQEHEGMLSAAGIAYYVAVSLFPLLLVLVAVLGWVLAWTDVGKEAHDGLVGAVEQQASPELAAQVEQMLRVVSDRAGTSGPIGFVVLVISAVIIFAQLDSSFDRIFKTPPDPQARWWHWIGRLLFQRLKALAMLLAVGAFILLAMFGSTVLSKMQQAMGPQLENAGWVSWATSFWLNMVLNFLAFTLLYRVVPQVEIRWRDAAQGAIVASILWEAGRQALSAYFLQLDYPTAYGVIGSFLVVMLWAFYGSLLLLFGAEYTRVCSEPQNNA